jgi:hypothetical protein
MMAKITTAGESSQRGYLKTCAVIENDGENYNFQRITPRGEYLKTCAVIENDGENYNCRPIGAGRPVFGGTDVSCFPGVGRVEKKTDSHKNFRSSIYIQYEGQ